jgi:chemotaxis protein methyltransferase CheR
LSNTRALQTAAGVSLSASPLDRMRALARERAGIELGEGKEAFLAARTAHRIHALGLEDLAAYAQQLEHADEAELDHFVDAITTNFTSFMREDDHFELLSRLAERWRTDVSSPLRVWIAGTATGEEAYSSAMVLDRALAPRGGSYRVWATDISTRALAKARAALYTENEIAGVPPGLRASAFESPRTTSGVAGAYRVLQRLRQNVSFERVNLAARVDIAPETFDVIMCRNVLIYFGAAARQTLVTTLDRSLRPGGVLMIGHAESLAGLRSGLVLMRPSVFAKPTHP